MLPDVFERIAQQIAEKKLLLSKKKVAGVHGTVRKNAELCCPGRAADEGKLGAALYVREESRTENRAHLLIGEVFFYGCSEFVERHRVPQLIVVQGVPVDEIESFRLECKDIIDHAWVLVPAENGFDHWLLCLNKSLDPFQGFPVIDRNSDSYPASHAHDLFENGQVCPVRAHVNLKAGSHGFAYESDDVPMHGGFAADDVDCLNRYPLKDLEHSLKPFKGHVRHSLKRPVEAKIARPVAPERRIELYVVRTGSHC